MIQEGTSPPIKPRIEPRIKEGRLQRRDLATQETTIVQAYEIAARDLRACYNPDGIVAGRTHFNSYWSRDGFWAVFGALELRDFDQAKQHLQLFIEYQRPTGQMPVRIEFLTHTFGGYHGLRSRLAPIFRSSNLARPVDPTSLFVMAIWQYYRHTKDKQFLKANFLAVQRAIGWLNKLDRDNDGLLEVGILADWMDSIIKWGKLLHVNIMYYKSLDNIAKICDLLGQDQGGKKYRQMAQTTLQAIRSQLWNGGYFVDWRRGNRQGGFCADGNVLAILYEIADKAQARMIVRYVKSNHLELETGIHTVYPAYRWYQVLPTYYLYGISDYHSRLLWPWISSLYALAKWRIGYQDDGLKTLANLAQLFLRHDFVGEVYEPNGAVLRRSIYQSEVPFAWNAAAFIYAVKSIGIAGKHQVMVK